MRKRTKIIFTLSVLLNILFIGVIAGGAYQKFQRHSWHETKKELSPEAQNVMAANFQKTRTQMHELFQTSRKQRRAMMDILKAEEFDAQAYDQAAKALQETQNKISQFKIDAVREISSSVPYEDRKKLARKMSRVLLSGSHKDSGKYSHSAYGPHKIENVRRASGKAELEVRSQEQ